MNGHTAQSLRGAAAQVLSVLDNWESVDVRTIDVDDAFRRFMNKKASQFKQGSLQAYSKRWPIAVRSFLEYAANPAAWKAPASDKPTVLKRERKNNGTTIEETVPEVSARTPAAPAMPPTSPTSGLVDYPFPLREGRLAYLRLPVDLKQAEVKRLTAFLNTLAVDAEAA